MTIFDFKRQKGAYHAHSTIILDKKSEQHQRLIEFGSSVLGVPKFFAGLLNSIFLAPSSILAKAGGAGFAPYDIADLS
jgi:hypothetical protein